MDVYSSVSGILVVHISDYSGKLCLSAGLEREFTMFWTNHRAYSDHMYYLWHYGYVLLCNILLFPQPKNGIFCKYIFLADWNFKTWLPASHQLYCFFMQICYCKIKYIFWKILCCQLTIYTKGKPWLRVKKYYRNCERYNL